MSVLDRFAIEREIGRGGMGVVSYALDTELERDVALKELTLPPTMTLASAAEAIERFKREAQTSAMMDSPHVVEVLDAFSEGIRHFIVMEYVEGPTLDEVLKNGPLPLEAAMGVAEQILEALTAAHTAGIVHRDLKPENVFVQEDGLVKVGDFGIARLTTGDSGLTRTGQTLGTIGYMPPEQVRGEEVDARGDVFAAGVVLYQMLIGTNPFHAEQPTTSMYKISYEDPPALDPFIPELPAHITPILAKAMAKDIDLRYQSAEEMLSDIRSGTAPDVSAILEASAARAAEKEKAAVPAVAVQQASDWKSRIPFKLDKRALIALGAGLVLLLGLGGGIAAIGQQRAAEQQKAMAAQQAAILAEAKKADACSKRVAALRLSLDSAAASLRRRAAINKSAVARWDAQWKTKLDKYKARVSKVEAHNTAERTAANAPLTPTSTWDPYWMRWVDTYPDPYVPDIWKSPSYPKTPGRISASVTAEVAAIDALLASAASLKTEITTASVGARYFQTAFKKESSAVVAVEAAASALRGTAVSMAVQDPRKGTVLNGDKVNSWSAQAADQAIQELQQTMLRTISDYGLKAGDLSATSTPPASSTSTPAK